MIESCSCKREETMQGFASQAQLGRNSSSCNVLHVFAGCRQASCVHQLQSSFSVSWQARFRQPHNLQLYGCMGVWQWSGEKHRLLINVPQRGGLCVVCGAPSLVQPWRLLLRLGDRVGSKGPMSGFPTTMNTTPFGAVSATTLGSRRRTTCSEKRTRRKWHGGSTNTVSAWRR